jgi:hypothetical protein
MAVDSLANFCEEKIWFRKEKERRLGGRGRRRSGSCLLGEDREFDYQLFLRSNANF